MANSYRFHDVNFTYTVNSKHLKLKHNIIDGNRVNLTLDLSGTITKVLVSGEVRVTRNHITNSIKRSYEICKFLANPKAEPMIYAIFQQLNKDPRHKIPYKCPVEPVSVPLMCTSKSIKVCYLDLIIILFDQTHLLTLIRSFDRLYVRN